MRLSIVIPTWNGLALLQKCLESLGAQTWRDFEIVVSDDGSMDGTLDFLRVHHPDVLVEHSDKNRGFAAAVNQGIGRTRGDWVFLLNNDVTLAPDCLELLMRAADCTDAAMLTPLVLWTEDPRLVYSAGDRIGINGRPESIGFRQQRNEFAAIEEPFGVSGGYGLFRGDLLEKVGLLDPAFGAYFEDADLCFRARWAGFSAAIVPEALAWHVGSASIAGRTWWRTRQCYRNHALLVLKNFSLRMLLGNAPALLAERRHQCFRLFRAARAEWGAARAAGFLMLAWMDLIANTPRALMKRRSTLGNRVLDDSAMQALLGRGASDA